MQYRAQGADNINAEVVKEAGVLRCQNRFDHVGRNFLKGDGVVLPYAALAYDFTIDVGKSHRKFAALVPHIART